MQPERRNACCVSSRIAIYLSHSVMNLSEKLRSLRSVEGVLRGSGRAMTQGELVRALQDELGESLSQSYLSQIESGTRPHLTNTSRGLLARFFKVHPGYLVDDPEGYHAELLSDLRHEVTEDVQLDLWLSAGAERFGRVGRDTALEEALGSIAQQADSRRCLLLLQAILNMPELAEQLKALLLPSESPAATTPRWAAAGLRDALPLMTEGDTP